MLTPGAGGAPARPTVPSASTRTASDATERPITSAAYLERHVHPRDHIGARRRFARRLIRVRDSEQRPSTCHASSQSSSSACWWSTPTARSAEASHPTASTTSYRSWPTRPSHRSSDPPRQAGSYRQGRGAEEGGVSGGRLTLRAVTAHRVKPRPSHAVGEALRRDGAPSIRSDAHLFSRWRGRGQPQRQVRA
jgi:hypothetical protein